MRLIEFNIGEDKYVFSPKTYEGHEKTSDSRTTEPFISVIIGPNAPGKSRCLSKLLMLF